MRIGAALAALSVAATATPLLAQAPAPTPAAAPAPDNGFTPALFDLWAKMRTGTGDPVYWYSVGTLREYPSGRLLANVEGYDTARSARPSPGVVQQFNRKIYIYRDPRTGAVLREVGGRKVEPVAYPYQFITYTLNGRALETMVEQGTGANVRRIGPGREISARVIGDAAVFTAPVFLDFPLPGGARYQAFENYDFVIPMPYRGGDQNRLSWVRYGANPAWAGGGPGIMHLVTWRVDRYADLPATMRAYVDAEAPLWREPPKDLADIRRLQGVR